MAYTALYRKLRSQTFSDMIGQEAIVKTLKNQVISDRVPHAYLFCGIRGTGKTSAARILSRAINCENAAEGEPCNECDVCLDILNDRSLNVIEMNAADKTGVDDVRKIIEECDYPPASGRYKIYIIDEAHMFSPSAFNALLKTLEEPPAFVIFILATTEPQKILATIRSRCQRFDFKRISNTDIAAHLKSYTQSSGINIEDDALKYIAALSDGAMRDAIGILEQCVSFYINESITLPKVQDLLGSVDTSVLFELTDALYNGDSIGCMEIINKAILAGRDIARLVSESLTHFRNILVSTSASGDIPIDTTDENIAKLREQGKRIPRNELIRYVYAFSEFQGKLKLLPNERVMLEVCCLKLCAGEESAAPKSEPLKQKRRGGNDDIESKLGAFGVSYDIE